MEYTKKRRSHSRQNRMGALVLILSGMLLNFWSYGCSGTVASNGSSSSPQNPPTTTSLSISSIVSSAITADGATITWTTNVAASSQVDYGTGSSYGQSSPLNSSMVTTHSVKLSRVWRTRRSITVASIPRTRTVSLESSSDFTFTTAAAPNNGPATVLINSLTQGAAVSGSVTVTATASSSVGIAGVQFAVDATNLGSAAVSHPYSCYLGHHHSLERGS